MRIFTIGTFLFIILTTLSVHLIYGQKSQLNSKELPKLRVDVWQMDQGLPVNSITTIAQTADGWMFFGTEEGLVRFDGNSFLVWNKSNMPGFYGLVWRERG